MMSRLIQCKRTLIQCKLYHFHGGRGSFPWGVGGHFHSQIINEHVLFSVTTCTPTARPNGDVRKPEIQFITPKTPAQKLYKVTLKNTHLNTNHPHKQYRTGRCFEQCVFLIGNEVKQAWNLCFLKSNPNEGTKDGDF